jgi:hypothetical protein
LQINMFVTTELTFIPTGQTKKKLKNTRKTIALRQNKSFVVQNTCGLILRRRVLRINNTKWSECNMNTCIIFSTEGVTFLPPLCVCKYEMSKTVLDVTVKDTHYGRA